MARADIVSILIADFHPWIGEEEEEERKFPARPKNRSLLRCSSHPPSLARSVSALSALMVNSKGVYDTVNGRRDNEGRSQKGRPI